MVEVIAIIYFIGVILAMILTKSLTEEMYPNEDSSVIILIISALSWISILLWIFGKDEEEKTDGDI